MQEVAVRREMEALEARNLKEAEETVDGLRRELQRASDEQVLTSTLESSTCSRIQQLEPLATWKVVGIDV
jgi:hypothetical protein